MKLRYTLSSAIRCGSLSSGSRRIAADLSLRELSERASVSNAYLSQLERGLHEPSLSVLKAIAAALGLSLIHI